VVRNAFRLMASACWAATIALASPADAKRVALVIGNADYRIGPLSNPGNDAAAVATALQKQLKFDTVVLQRNLGADAFRAALRDMARASRGADVGVIFFAGHGLEVGGRNFLIPVDANLAAARDVELEAIALDTVLAQLDGVTRLRLVILDACRNNPFALAGATRSVRRGFAAVEPEGNTLVAYAAKDGTTADDGEGQPNSPFTEALLKHMVRPGLEIRQLFGYVRDEVIAATGRQQQPFLYGSLGGQGVFLYPQASAPEAPASLAAPSSATGPAPTAQSTLTELERAWAAVRTSTDIAVLRAFLQQYGPSNAVYERLAEARIEELKKKSPPSQPPSCGPGTVEKNGVCVARSAPDRGSASPKAARPPKRVQRPPRENDKPGMCWTNDRRSASLVPCSDPRATMRAY
jgi:uncharacterized caspase-like protein